jgi:hypothetical protein
MDKVRLISIYVHGYSDALTNGGGEGSSWAQCAGSGNCRYDKICRLSLASALANNSDGYILDDTLQGLQLHNDKILLHLQGYFQCVNSLTRIPSSAKSMQILLLLRVLLHSLFLALHMVKWFKIPQYMTAGKTQNLIRRMLVQKDLTALLASC